MMDERGETRRRQSWRERFAVAGRGIIVAIRTEVSFYVHLLAAAAVVVFATLQDVSRLEWCLLVICIGMVLGAELLNTAIERLARAVTDKENPHIRDALDIASGAVLIMALFAAVVGTIVLIA